MFLILCIIRINAFYLDTSERTPTGYASSAKETEDETALPAPGSRLFKPEHGDHMRILRNVRKFISTVSERYFIFKVLATANLKI